MNEWNRKQASFVNLVIGAFFGLAFAKWGNVVVLSHLIQKPTETVHLIFFPWPIEWAYTYSSLILLGLLILNIKNMYFQIQSERQKSISKRWDLGRFVVLSPFLWIGWVSISAFFTKSPQLTKLVMAHLLLTSCWYGAGRWYNVILEDVQLGKYFWLPFLIGITWCMAYGFQQHLGGLKQLLEQIKDSSMIETVPPELLKRLEKGRIFGTLFYPNTLAGALILIAPPMGWFIYQWIRTGVGPRASLIALGIWIISTFLLLLWTKSKAGCLIVLVLGITFIGLLLSKKSIKYFLLVSMAILMVGMLVFFMGFREYFKVGAPSIGSRFTFWISAIFIAKQNPIVGTGPGSFKVEYENIRPLQAEPSWLVHNDYLQQICDSGIIAGIFYIGSWLGILLGKRPSITTGLPFWLWIALTGYALHSLVEFHLYIPALAWPAFFFLGWLSRYK